MDSPGPVPGADFRAVALAVAEKVWYTVWRYAGMMELVDMPDLGSCAERRVGSSPTTRTMKKAAVRLLFSTLFAFGE